MSLNTFLMWFKVLNCPSTLNCFPFTSCHLTICEEAPFYHPQPRGEAQPPCLLSGRLWGLSSVPGTQCPVSLAIVHNVVVGFDFF